MIEAKLVCEYVSGARIHNGFLKASIQVDTTKFGQGMLRQIGTSLHENPLSRIGRNDFECVRPYENVAPGTSEISIYFSPLMSSNAQTDQLNAFAAALYPFICINECDCTRMARH